jgi:periplasmic copper chaperone A
MRQFSPFLIPIALFLNACQLAAPEGVTNLKVRLPVIPDRPGVAYFDISAGKADQQLVSISSPDIIRIELHESKTENGKMKMRPLEGGVAVAAGTTVKFQPGGKHAMLFDINPRIKPGAQLPLAFKLGDGRILQVNAAVEAAGQSGEAHEGAHDH